LGENIRDYWDFNIQAGEHYEYSIVAKNVFGTGSASKAVGFVNPNGVVSGKVETISGNPVPGVEVRLSPLTGSSLLFDGINDELCVSYHEEFPTSKFTISAYVKLGKSNDEGTIIDWGSTLNKNWWITTTKKTEPSGFIFNIGNGNSRDSLKYFLPNNINDWHQITMIYNGSTMSVLVDGEFIGTKSSQIARVKNYLNIGSNIGIGGFFNGNIDDIRIYNRPLTQSEVMNTKNRSVSKGENGLITYWKMDEGVGSKVFDNSLIPTNASIYGATFSSSKPEVYSAGVTDVSGYYIIDGINYSQSEGFQATPMKNFDFNTALEFNAADKSYATLTDFDIPDTSTVEILFHPFDLKSKQSILSKGKLLDVYITDGKLFLSLNQTIIPLGILKSKYYHLAVTLDNTKGNASVYLEGNLLIKDIKFSGNSNWKDNNAWLLGTNTVIDNDGNFYTGLVDEFAVYKTALSQNIIQYHYVNGIAKDTTNSSLQYSYFDLNESMGTKVFDYAAINFGAADSREGSILKANWSNNAKYKKTEIHEFEPNIKIVNLNTSNTAIGNIDFRDVSTIQISGYVRYANTICFEKEVEIKVNGQEYFPPIFTDKNGKWSADIEPGRSIKLTAHYKDHIFGPSFFEIRKIQSPKAGIVFLDNTKRKIRGQVAGNTICKNSIIPNNSRVVLKVASLDGCFEKTDTLKNPDGKFTFNDLPASIFKISVVEHSNSIIYNYFQTKGGVEVDLRTAPEDTVDFIYIAPPVVEISKPTENKCNLPIMNQAQKYKTTIKVYESYTGGNCYLSDAKLSITNSIADSTKVFHVEMKNGKYEYEYLAGNPNLLPPHRKIMQVVAEVNNQKSQDTISAIVLGKKARASTFISKSPQIPFLILRDPPGDQSYSFMEKKSTFCFNLSASVNYGQNFENSTEYSYGSELTTSLGIGAETELTIERENNYNITSNISYTVGSNKSLQTCLTTNEIFSTSSSLLSNEEGDLYAGVAINFIYGLSDVLKYDTTTCIFINDQNLNITPKGFETRFMYSESQIRNKIIEEESKGNITDANQWRYILEKNTLSKAKAAFEKNISFDAGVTYSSSSTNSVSEGFSTNFMVEESANFALENGIKINGIGITEGFSTTISISGASETSTETNFEKTIGYVLGDDDLGDNFTINIKKDNEFGTPVFELVAGESSCPHEANTRPRSEPSLISVDGLTRVNISDNSAAVNEILLGNSSPTEEQMTYELSLDNTTNSGGAIVKVGGQVLSQGISYTIPYGESRKVLVTLERDTKNINAPYVYNGITILFKSTCEENDSLFTRSLALNATFIEPCSPVNISFPKQDWVLTPSSGDKLNITLVDYNIKDIDLDLIRLQYRPIGGDGSWINIKDVKKANLGNTFTIEQWNTSNVKDGLYEIRAVAECNNPSLASGISTILKGEIARTPPIIVGIPEPGDGTWDPGDEISVTFNEAISCDRVIQADLLSNNTIGLYDATTNKLVDANITCVSNKIIIVPNINSSLFENRNFRVMVSGKDYDDAIIAQNPNHQRMAIRDKAGNSIEKSIKWEFAINQNNLEWVGTDIIETNEVLKLFSTKRQIRNRGGNITSFKMESIPSWITISPSTGTLNPGQVADISITFQQDLLIGDYLDTLQLTGSKGKEPLLVDYRVRCPQPKFEVINPEQYEGTMNMVIDLSIFGIHSTDPSDIIIAKINGQTRGVGKVAYFRNIPSDKHPWLVFLTIYGNQMDAKKNIEFVIWDGDKCREYAEIQQAFTYNEGSLIGSPLSPTPINVLNIVSKCIPLNKGWNWVSFNVDLSSKNSTNSVSNTLFSLKNKTSALIKDDTYFAKYYGDTINNWKGTLKLINPTKRYLVYLANKDTVCIKGTPYKPEQYPINLVKGWNWIGYIPSAGGSVSQLLKNINALNGDIIKSQTLFAQYVAGLGWIGNLNYLEPNKGYLLNVSNPSILSYQSSNTTTNNSQKSNNSLALNSAHPQESSLPFEFSQYQSTMNIIAKISGIVINPEDELRAYFSEKLIGMNKPITYANEQIFFQTIYFNDSLKIAFKLYKADRKKEYDLDNSIVFSNNTILGKVEKPLLFSLLNLNNTNVGINISNQIIKQPIKSFQTISVKNNLIPQNANCTRFAYHSVLPSDTISRKPCISEMGFDGNMFGVMKLTYNERTGFTNQNDIIKFINPNSGKVVGCADFDSEFNVFNYIVKGGTSSVESPIDIIYYSNTLKSYISKKSAILYKNNKELGDYFNPYSVNLAPLTISSDNNGNISAALVDTSWTGKYCIDAFAMNCSGYNDGQIQFCFQRLKGSECVDVSVRKNTETSNTIVQALNISSEAITNNAIKVEYKAGNIIELKPGFQTKSGSVFIGTIEGCSNKRR